MEVKLPRFPKLVSVPRIRCLEIKEQTGPLSMVSFITNNLNRIIRFGVKLFIRLRRDKGYPADFVRLSPSPPPSKNKTFLYPVKLSNDLGQAGSESQTGI